MCTPASKPADILVNEHLTSPPPSVNSRLADGVVAKIASGFFELDGRRAGPQTPPPSVGEHTDAVFAALGERRAAPSTRPEPAPPLAGLRVMDFGHGGVGVEAGRRYAEYGADVIKIESRTYPDFIRIVLGSEMNPSFCSSSRSKRALGTNAKTPEGRELLFELVKQSDVVIENNSTGTMDKLGIGYDDLSAVNPRIAMASSQLMGSHGAWSWWRGYGPSTQPPGGLLHLWNCTDRDDPAGSVSIFPDHVAGCLCAVGTLATLVGRERGVVQGAHVEVAQVEAVVNTLADLLAAESVEAGSVVPLGNASEQGAPWGMYRCAGEEQWVAITCRDDADWQGLVAALGAPAWAADAALAGVDARRARAAELDLAIGEWTAGLAPAQVAAACQEHGVPAVPLINGQAMTTDPQYVARGFAVNIDQPGIGRIDLEGAAFVGDLVVGPDIRPAPMVGEHTREIAKELLGLDDAGVDRLLAAGVLETTPPVHTHSSRAARPRRPPSLVRRTRRARVVPWGRGVSRASTWRSIVAKTRSFTACASRSASAGASDPSAAPATIAAARRSSGAAQRRRVLCRGTARRCARCWRRTGGCVPRRPSWWPGPSPRRSRLAPDPARRWPSPSGG